MPPLRRCTKASSWVTRSRSSSYSCRVTYFSAGSAGLQTHLLCSPRRVHGAQGWFLSHRILRRLHSTVPISSGSSSTASGRERTSAAKRLSSSLLLWRLFLLFLLFVTVQLAYGWEHQRVWPGAIPYCCVYKVRRSFYLAFHGVSVPMYYLRLSPLRRERKVQESNRSNPQGTARLCISAFSLHFSRKRWLYCQKHYL